jgi:hypothetical protein
LFILGWNGAYIADLKTLFGSGFINGNHCPWVHKIQPHWFQPTLNPIFLPQIRELK